MWAWVGGWWVGGWVGVSVCAYVCVAPGCLRVRVRAHACGCGWVHKTPSSSCTWARVGVQNGLHLRVRTLDTATSAVRMNRLAMPPVAVAAGLASSSEESDRVDN